MNSITKDVLHRIFELNDLLPDLKDIAIDITEAVEIITTSLKNGGKVMFCGNGGSASQSSHLSTEISSRFLINRKPYSAISLTADTTTLTANSNDFGYDSIFSKQVEAIGKPGDVLVGLSTSGASENVHAAFLTADGIGIKTILMTGSKGGIFKKSFIDKLIVVPSDQTPRIQECHLLIGHIICEMIEKELSQEEK